MDVCECVFEGVVISARGARGDVVKVVVSRRVERDARCVCV